MTILVYLTYDDLGIYLTYDNFGVLDTNLVYLTYDNFDILDNWQFWYSWSMRILVHLTYDNFCVLDTSQIIWYAWHMTIFVHLTYFLYLTSGILHIWQFGESSPDKMWFRKTLLSLFILLLAKVSRPTQECFTQTAGNELVLNSRPPHGWQVPEHA